jgi:phosphatidylglycerol---prolipoprotein diacylglyceryl transferase
MHSLSYIIWNASPDIFSLPIDFWIFDFTLTLRWYGLLFALGFLLSQQILYYIFKKEGKPEKDVDTLTIYMVIATVIGARLGHVLFYEPERYLSNPIDIIKIWEGGLASHGATVGILFALWLYGRKKFVGQNYLQTLDRIVILVALTGALIRFGNFMNSEIIGKPTQSDYGVVFARNVTEVLKGDGSVTQVNYVEQDTTPNTQGYMPIKILLEFEKGQANSLEGYYQYVDNRVDGYLSYNAYVREHINQTETDYDLSQDEAGTTYAIINTYAIPRHPAQLYESISCLMLFGFLFFLWTRHKEKLPEGRLFSIFLIVCFGLRIVFEFLKENQVDFENNLPLNMGQLLSIPLVLVGVFMLIRSYRKEKVSE